MEPSGINSIDPSEELAALYDAAPVGLCILDTELRYVRINERLAEINGIPAADHIGRTVHEIVPDLTDQAVAAMKRVLEGEEVWGIELSGTTRAQPGVVRTWRENWLPLRNANGSIVGVTLSAEEITDTKVTEAALKESEQRFRHMADFAPVMIWVTDASGECTYLNRAWFEFTGQSEAEAKGFGWLDAVHPDDRGWSGDTFLKANADREPFQLEYRLRHKDGEYRWAIDAASPRFGSDGQFLGYIGSVIDIHERRVAEDALESQAAEAIAGRSSSEQARRATSALYRTYFENTPEALFIIGVEPDGGFVVEEINPAHEAGVGLKLSEVRGKRIEDILPDELALRVIETYRHVVQTGSIYQYRELFDIGGKPEHWDTALVPMRDERQCIVRLLGSSRNVSRQVQAEEALRQAQKMEAIGQITGGVAHDFNNLLTPIVGALDSLQRKGMGGEREQRMIAAAIQSADKAATLVQRLLAFARRQPLQMKSVQVGQLVDQMQDLLESTIGPQIELAITTASELPPAEVDANQLEMAILNLAVNARDAMPSGGRLEIATRSELVGPTNEPAMQPGRYVVLSVADTGIGMDEDTLNRATEPFFSTKGVGKGTGLGLSMVHGLASQMGGRVTIQSAPGSGTTVEVWLPEGAPVDATEAGAQGPAFPSQRGTVLLVEDEPLVRMSTADMLEDLGFDVHEADCAESALAALADGIAPQYLVTDHLMPGMSGGDLARIVAAQYPGTKIIIASGYTDNPDLQDFPRLNKPFRSEDLVACLDALG